MQDIKSYNLSTEEVDYIERRTGMKLIPNSVDVLGDFIHSGVVCAIEKRRNQMNKESYDNLMKESNYITGKFMRTTELIMSIENPVNEIYCVIEKALNNHIQSKVDIEIDCLLEMEFIGNPGELLIPHIDFGEHVVVVNGHPVRFLYKDGKVNIETGGHRAKIQVTLSRASVEPFVEEWQRAGIDPMDSRELNKTAFAAIRNQASPPSFTMTVYNEATNKRFEGSMNLMKYEYKNRKTKDVHSFQLSPHLPRF